MPIHVEDFRALGRSDAEVIQAAFDALSSEEDIHFADRLYAVDELIEISGKSFRAFLNGATVRATKYYNIFRMRSEAPVDFIEWHDGILDGNKDVVDWPGKPAPSVYVVGADNEAVWKARQLHGNNGLLGIGNAKRALAKNITTINAVSDGICFSDVDYAIAEGCRSYDNAPINFSSVREDYGFGFQSTVYKYRSNSPDDSGHIDVIDCYAKGGSIGVQYSSNVWDIQPEDSTVIVRDCSFSDMGQNGFHAEHAVNVEIHDTDFFGGDVFIGNKTEKAILDGLHVEGRHARITFRQAQNLKTGIVRNSTVICDDPNVDAAIHNAIEVEGCYVETAGREAIFADHIRNCEIRRFSERAVRGVKSMDNVLIDNANGVGKVGFSGGTDVYVRNVSDNEGYPPPPDGWSPINNAPDPTPTPGDDAMQWQTYTLDFDGPQGSEDRATFEKTLTVTFTHEDGRVMTVPGFFAADGNAGETGATEGNVWRCYFTPPLEGKWDWQASGVVSRSGTFDVVPSNARGGLVYDGTEYLKWAGTGETFFKTGVGSPENLLGYYEFDNTPDSHKYAPHVKHWRPGDPTWKGGKGKGIIGAVNYLADQGVNSCYMMLMNIGGDGKDVMPWADSSLYDLKARPGHVNNNKVRVFDVSKLDQWGIVFRHMQARGITLHLFLQETENDNLLDNGKLGDDRKLFLREMVARFAHHNAIIWNLGEENSNTTGELKDHAGFLKSIDAYQHPVALHTYPNEHSKYEAFEGTGLLDVLSFQTSADTSVPDVVRYQSSARKAGHPVVAFLDEPGNAKKGLMAKGDSGYQTNWNNLKSVVNSFIERGGSGVSWYFGYQTAGGQGGDLKMEDFSLREDMYQWAAGERAKWEGAPVPDPIPDPIPGGDMRWKTVNDIAVMQAENGAASNPNDSMNSNWALKDTLSGHTGRGYIAWEGPNLYSTPGAGALQFPVYVDAAGTYWLSIRGSRPNNGAASDLNNDFWVRMDGGEWEKIYFTGKREKWNWGRKFDKNHKKSDAKFGLSAGWHTLEISGRSEEAYLDKIHLSLGGLDMSDGRAETVYDQTAPDPSPDPDPTPDPTPDPDPIPDPDLEARVAALEGKLAAMQSALGDAAAA